MSPAEIELALRQLLAGTNVEVSLGSDAVQDLKGYRKEINIILALIAKQAQKGPLIKPDGIGDPLSGALAGFTKIKPKAMSLRIVYRPTPLPNGIIRMEIIAIGPKNREEVYDMAARRLMSFQSEILRRIK